MKEVLIPATGFAMTEALLVRWYKQAGDQVSIGEAIAEIETDKVTADLESPATGVLGAHLAAEGAVVAVGVPLTHILEDADPPTEREAQEGPRTTGPDTEPERAANSSVSTTPDRGVDEERAPTRTAGLEGQRHPHDASPRQRMLARRAAQAAADASGETDSAPSVDSSPAPGQDGRAIESGGGSFRDAIAARVVESWRTIPHFGVTREVSAEAVLSIRAARVRRAEVVPSVTDLLLRALAAALRDGGQDGAIDVGLAVATDRGVVIPVIRDVFDLDLSALASARRLAIERARNGKLPARDLSDPPPTTLSNLGPFGVDQFTGVIALGQTSLLTIGRIARRVVPVADGVAIRATFHATLNVDHRAFDGADAARLLVAFANAAEDEHRLEREAFR